MGIFCEMNLSPTKNRVFVSGSTVSGTIKYAFDEDTTIKRITVSLKGSGYLQVRNKNKDHGVYAINNETYVDEDHIIKEDGKGFQMSKGVYEHNFSFQLPANAPPSLHYENLVPIYNIRCVIAYYIRIKFERSGIFSFNNHFKKNIIVVTRIIPRLPIVPSIYEDQKCLIQSPSSKENFVNIRANVESCVISPGGKIELDYEIINKSSVVIEGVETKMYEVYTVKPLGHPVVRVVENIVGTERKASPVDLGDSQRMHITMNVPAEVASIECSNMVLRDYFIRITVELPTPYENAKFEIPVQIGVQNMAIGFEYDPHNANSLMVDQGNANAVPCEQCLPSAPHLDQISEDPPPSYWEAMKDQDSH